MSTVDDNYTTSHTYTHFLRSLRLFFQHPRVYEGDQPTLYMYVKKKVTGRRRLSEKKGYVPPGEYIKERVNTYV